MKTRKRLLPTFLLILALLAALGVGFELVKSKVLAYPVGAVEQNQAGLKEPVLYSDRDEL